LWPDNPPLGYAPEYDPSWTDNNMFRIEFRCAITMFILIIHNNNFTIGRGGDSRTKD